MIYLLIFVGTVIAVAVLRNAYIMATLPPQENPNAPQGPDQRLREYRCRKHGHLAYVPSYSRGYPGMPQSHCYRCGKKTSRAADHCREWEAPIGENR